MTTDHSREAIEVRLAFLERSGQELSDVVYRQQQEIDALRKSIRRMSERLEAASQPREAGSPESERPPHY